MIQIDRIDRQTDNEATVTISGPVEDVSVLTTGEYPGLEGLTRVIKTVLTLGKPSQEDKLTEKLARQDAELRRMAKWAPDEEAVKYKEYYPVWTLKGGLVLNPGDRFVWDDELYKSIDPRTLTTAPKTTPNKVATSYVKINDPNVSGYPWWRPGAYAKGYMCWHNDVLWESQVDSNTYEPGNAGDRNWVWVEVPGA